jgi:hypothetical protein
LLDVTVVPQALLPPLPPLFGSLLEPLLRVVLLQIVLCMEGAPVDFLQLTSDFSEMWLVSSLLEPLLRVVLLQTVLYMEVAHVELNK